jgi:hypothetical protein
MAWSKLSVWGYVPQSLTTTVAAVLMLQQVANIAVAVKDKAQQ